MKRFLVRLTPILLLAGAIRGWQLWTIRDRDLGFTDELWYWNWARIIGDGRGYLNPFRELGDIEIPTAGHPPLYSTLLAVPARLGLDSPTQMRVLTALIGVAAVLVVALLARELAGDRAGWIAGGLAAVYPHLWVNDTALMPEALFGLLVATALLVTVRFWRAPRAWLAAALAAVLGLAALTRSEAVLLYVLLALPLALLVPGLTRRRRVELVGLMALVGALVMGPWVVRNLTTFERPTYLATGSGIVLAYGSCDAAWEGRFLGYWSVECAPQFDGSAFEDESLVDADARADALDYIREHWTRYPVVALARVGRVWELYRPAQNVDFNAFFERRGEWQSWAGLGAYYVLMAGAIGGLVVLKRRGQPIFPFLAVAGVVTITVALSFGITRYRAGVDVLLPALAAVAVDRVVAARAARRAPARGTADPDGSDGSDGLDDAVADRDADATAGRGVPAAPEATA